MDEVRDSRTAFWIGRLPSAKRLPFVLRVPLPREGPLFFAAADSWPRGKDVFCRQLAAWPDVAETVEEVPVESCWRVGKAVHLTLRRARARRCLFAWTQSSTGREVIFWRSQASIRAARPGLRMPQARGLERSFEIAVDVAERFPWRFGRRAVTVVRRALPVGDYAVIHEGRVVAAVERKTAADLAKGAMEGELDLVLGELGRVAHAALVVEGRLSDVIKAAQHGKNRTGWLLNLLVSLQVGHRSVQWTFAESPRLAEEWAYRWLSAATHARTGRRPERVSNLGAMPLQAELPYAPSVLDAPARRAVVLREAEAGTVWTSHDVSERCGVTVATAASDLRRLVRDGVLRAQGHGRSRTYSAATTPLTIEGPTSR